MLQARLIIVYNAHVYNKIALTNVKYRIWPTRPTHSAHVLLWSKAQIIIHGALTLSIEQSCAAWIALTEVSRSLRVHQLLRLYSENHSSWWQGNPRFKFLLAVVLWNPNFMISSNTPNIICIFNGFAYKATILMDCKQNEQYSSKLLSGIEQPFLRQDRPACPTTILYRPHQWWDRHTGSQSTSKQQSCKTSQNLERLLWNTRVLLPLENPRNNNFTFISQKQTALP